MDPLETSSNVMRIAPVLIGLTLTVALLIALPFALYALRPAYRGLVPIRLADDGAYEDRIQTALLGRFREVDNGITRREDQIRGAGPAGVELAAGFLLQWTGFHGPEVAVLLMILLGPLLLPLLALLLRSIGCSNVTSCIGASLYTLTVLSTLERPVNLSSLFPSLFWSLFS